MISKRAEGEFMYEGTAKNIKISNLRDDPRRNIYQRLQFTLEQQDSTQIAVEMQANPQYPRIVGQLNNGEQVRFEAISDTHGVLHAKRIEVVSNPARIIALEADLLKDPRLRQLLFTLSILSVVSLTLNFSIDTPFFKLNVMLLPTLYWLYLVVRRIALLRNGAGG